MAYPDDLSYSKEHEWVRQEGSRATIGITSFAADELGDIVFVELPEVGAALSQFATFGVVESVKAVSDLFAPVSGEVVEVNDALREHAGADELGSVRRGLDREGRDRRSVASSTDCSTRTATLPRPPDRAAAHDLFAAHRCRPSADARRGRRRIGRGPLRRHPGLGPRQRLGHARRRSPSRRCAPSWRAWPAATGSRRSASSAPASTATSSRPWSARSSGGRSSRPPTRRTSRRCRRARSRASTSSSR